MLPKLELEDDLPRISSESWTRDSNQLALLPLN